MSRIHIIQLGFFLIVVSQLDGEMAMAAEEAAPVEKAAASVAHIPRGPGVPSDEELEKSGAVIGNIILDKQDIFDPARPGENRRLYRLVNRMHVETRNNVILRQLLFKPGDAYSRRILEESERILRSNRYLYDAHIVPVQYVDGSVDIAVSTRDLWTIGLGLSLSRKGGENKTDIEIEELNFLGTGSKLSVDYISDTDRDGMIFSFEDRQLGDSWVGMGLLYANNSDGDVKHLVVDRPFYALDSRWAAGLSVVDGERTDALYDVGERVTEFQTDERRWSAYYGKSGGWQNGWVNRWKFGLAYHDVAFTPTQNEPVPVIIPENRKFVYPFISFERLEDKFIEAENHDQIDRTEDFFLGARVAIELGWASENWGSDRDALIYSATVSRGYDMGQGKLLLASAFADGRWQKGNNANSLLGAELRFYHQYSDKSLFFTTLSAAVSHDLDVDNPLEIGGDNGLRGFPLRYQSGNARALLQIEQRYFTDWYPWKLFRVGGAIFADVGRAWGTNPVGEANLGWLTDVGFGLRLGSTRAGKGKVVHIDIAFPIDADPSIDSVQFIIEGKKGF
jgi:hypothetical protein